MQIFIFCSHGLKSGMEISADKKYDPNVISKVVFEEKCAFWVQSCQVWPFRGQKTNLAFFKISWPRIFYNLLSSWPYFNSRKVSIVKSKMLPFLKQRLAFVSYKHLATRFWLLNYWLLAVQAKIDLLPG